MVRKFTTPVEVPADPATTWQASTKNYVDTAVAGTVASSALTRTNLSPNPNAANSATGYVAKTDAFTGITAAPTQVTTGGANGSTTSVQAVVAASGSGEVALPQAVVTAGTQYTISVYVNAPAGVTAVLSVNWFASGAYSSTSVAAAVTPSAPRQFTFGTWVRLSYTVTAPVAVNQCTPYVSFYGVTAGQTVGLSQVLVEAAAGPGSYFDGGFPGGAWTGAAGSSTSTYSERAALAAAPTASPTFTGTVTATRVVRTPVTVTYAATTTIDASLGNHFRITMTGALTLALPTNLVDGQDVLVELIQDATGGRALTLGTGWNVTTALTGAITLTTTGGTRSYIGGKYRSAGAKLDVLAFATGVA